MSGASLSGKTSSIRHCAWDAGLAERMAELTIDAAGPIERCVISVDASLREYGFALLNNLAADRDDTGARERLCALGGQLGELVPQSTRGELIEDVKDFTDREHDDRGYRSRGELSPHTDPPTLIALHCLRRARSGGTTRLVNVQSVCDAIQATDAPLLQVLHEGFPHWRVAGVGGVAAAGPAPGLRPVLARANDLTSCMIYRPYVELAARESARPLSARQTDALDLFEQWADSETLALRFDLQPGDTLVVHNRAVLHARDDYQDWPEPARRRHLLRIWVDANERFPAPQEHAVGNLFAPTTN